MDRDLHDGLRVDDLDAPDCAMTEAAPWLLLAAAWTTGLALTAGWTVRTAWAVATRPDSRRYALTR